MAKQPAYKTIQNDIMQKIASGLYPAGAKLPTEAELSAQYGVSRITVQHALNELKTMGVLVRRQRWGTCVAQAAPAPPIQMPAIVPNSKSRLTLGVIASFDMGNDQVFQYLSGIISASDRSRDSLRLNNTCDEATHERAMLENCLADGCDGILYYPGRDPAPPVDLLTQIAASGYPCVLLDKQIYGTDLPCVQTDNVDAGRRITRELIQHGHREIAFLLGGYESSVRERYLGFCQELNAAGLLHHNRLCWNIGQYKAREGGMRELLDTLLGSGVTAVCCSADLHARWVKEACDELGISVPGQLAIGSFDGSMPGQIASMLQPYEQIGLTATEMLLRWILTGQAEHQIMRLPATYLPGQSI